MDALCSQYTNAHPNPTEPMSDRRFVSLLIQLYRESPELWNTKSNNYTNKTKRKQAFQKMLNVLTKYRPDFDEHKLKKKINVLRTNFNKECMKLRQKTLLAGSSGEIAEPNLWYFNEFLFIKEQSEDYNDICEAKYFGESTSFTTEITSPISPPKSSSLHSFEDSVIPDKKIKRNPSSPFEEPTGSPVPQYYHRSEYEADLLAKSWAIKLSRLAPDQRLFAEKIINDTLFEAEMGTLTRNGVKFLTSSDPLQPHCSGMNP